MRLRLGIAAGATVSILAWLLFLARGGIPGTLDNTAMTGGFYILAQLCGFGWAGLRAVGRGSLRDATLTGAVAGFTYAISSALPRTLLRLWDRHFMMALQYVAPSYHNAAWLLPNPTVAYFSAAFSAILINSLLGAAFALVGATLAVRPTEGLRL